MDLGQIKIGPRSTCCANSRSVKAGHLIDQKHKKSIQKAQKSQSGLPHPHPNAALISPSLSQSRKCSDEAATFSTKEAKEDEATVWTHFQEGKGKFWTMSQLEHTCRAFPRCSKEYQTHRARIQTARHDEKLQQH